jgi:hypothetical protein
LRPRTPEAPSTAPSTDEETEVVRTPVKKRRLLPWTEQGRLKFGLTDAVLGSVESKEDEEIPCGQPRWWDAAVQSSEDVVSLACESATEDDRDSFVVSDDSESLAAEVAASEECLGREALEEERLALVERVSRLEMRLAKTRTRLAEVERDLSGGVVPETQVLVPETPPRRRSYRRYVPSGGHAGGGQVQAACVGSS